MKKYLVLWNGRYTCCAECPIDEICTNICGRFDDEYLAEVELAYNIIHADENHKPELDEAHERFMNIGDAVHSPSHYCKGGIECIDAIRASMTKEAFAGYCKGNVIKYVFRYEQKGGKESLEKASVYLNWLIETEDGCQNGQE